VQAPPLSSLDTLQGDALDCASVVNEKRFSPALAMATFPLAAAIRGNIKVADPIPNDVGHGEKL
jgi:hypothetical protein